MGLNIQCLRLHGIECEDEDKVSAWAEIDRGIEIICLAVEERLEELGYDEDEYERGSNNEIDQLLAVNRYIGKISEASFGQCRERA